MLFPYNIEQRKFCQIMFGRYVTLGYPTRNASKSYNLEEITDLDNVKSIYRQRIDTLYKIGQDGVQVRKHCSAFNVETELFFKVLAVVDGGDEIVNQFTEITERMSTRPFRSDHHNLYLKSRF